MQNIRTCAALNAIKIRQKDIDSRTIDRIMLCRITYLMLHWQSHEDTGHCGCVSNHFFILEK
jgi:hypothetical protein